MDKSHELNIVEKSQSLVGSSSELLYGRLNNKLVHIEEVSHGLLCDCRCPHCDALLIAKKGNIRAHHFAHYASADCGAGAETALHLMAKQILVTHRCLLFPGESVSVDDNRFENLDLQRHREAELTQFERVEVEKSIGSYRPDLTALTSEGDWVDIEILVTHGIDDAKALEVTRAERTMIEIDLSYLPRDSSPSDIEHAVLWKAPRYFIHSSWSAETKIQLRQQLSSLYSEIDKSKNDAILKVNSNESVMLLGYKFGAGYSTGKQSNFEISHLFCVAPTQKNGTANFSIRIKWWV